MKLVIVESPSKAKTIEKYLGKDYKVLASYGHIRQLPSKKGSVDPENKFNIVWEETVKAKKQLHTIVQEAKKSKEIYLATDPDREGEAISWHIYNYLSEKYIINEKYDIKRVVVNSITKESITEALKSPRYIDNKLVSAYLARISLDYLVGFNISPILWHKLPGSKSAGRVQSVALKLICEKEEQIENFNIEEYWQIVVLFQDANNVNHNFKAKLIVFNNSKLEKLSIKTKEQALKVVSSLEKNKCYFIKEIVKKQLVKNPYAPFTTSSLQQDAFNKLGFSAKKTMTIAQKLYEGVTVSNNNVLGLITYMRTDATDIVPSFINEIRSYIKNNFGESYLPQKIHKYKTKTKNAQEAHEAIRPTQITMPPEKVKKYLTEDEFKLYNIIWNRAIASQMESAKYSNTSIYISNQNKDTILKASGTVLDFDGFYKVYYSSKDNKDSVLPNIEKNSEVVCKEISPSQHFTEPPPRYTEATLVKTLEELGIGRPSTYANIMSVLISRKYAYIENKKFHPEERGRILNSFLTKFFTKYVDYTFTATMEEDLDKISRGESSYFEVLNSFWQNFYRKVKDATTISPTEIVNALNDDLSDKFIGKDKTCPTCKKGTLLVKYSKFGAFVACSLYPECKHIENLKLKKVSYNDNKSGSHSNFKEKILDENLDTGDKIILKYGPYGPYIELKCKKNKAKRIAIPKNIDPNSINLKEAKFLLSLPIKFNDISLHIGRFGPYLKKDNDYYSLKNEDIFNLTEEKVKSIINEKIVKKQGIVLGKHPKTKETITLHKNRFSSYLLYCKQKIKLPKEYKNKEVSLQDILNVIDQNIT